MKFKTLVSQIGKPVSVQESLINRSTKWIAQHFGVSLRQAQRYKSGRATLDRPQDRAKRERVMGSADAETRRKVAASSIRDARAVNVGRVRLRYGDPGQRGRVGGGDRRNLGVVQLNDAQREKMAQAADALEAGDTERAEYLMNEAILDGKYGPLQIDDWPPGFHLI